MEYIIHLVFSVQALLSTTGSFTRAVRGTNTLPEKCFSALPWLSSASVPEMLMCLARDTSPEH